MSGLRRGLAVLVTRAPEQADELCDLLLNAGFEPVCLPLIAPQPVAETMALDGALRRLESYRWIVFSSANAVRFVAARAATLGLTGALARHRGIVAGPATAALLGQYGFRAALVPSPFSAERAAEALAARLEAGCPVLLPRAAGGREALASTLSALGAVVDEVVVYRTAPVPENGALAVQGLADGRFGAVAFFSPSAVHSLAAAAASQPASGRARSPRRLLEGVVTACIGPTTAHAVEEAGWQVDVVAPDTTAAALVEALARHVGVGSETHVVDREHSATYRAVTKV